MSDVRKPNRRGASRFSGGVGSSEPREDAPFERYLYDKGLFDDVVRPKITIEDRYLEPQEFASIPAKTNVIGYWKSEGRVTYCTEECHKIPKWLKAPTTIAAQRAA